MSPHFDKYADDYDAALAEGLSVSGEDKDYFARGRVAWLLRRLQVVQASTKVILDFGCGIGSSAPILRSMPGVQSYFGIDQSVGLLEKARRQYANEHNRFLSIEQHQPDGTVDLVFSNGVFHHIPLAERAGAVDHVYQSLKAGGIFALWENNPWNPGTRYVMSRIPFDRDAITLSSSATRALLRARGFRILRTDYLFIFPKVLSALRWSEAYVSWLPLGAQYLVLAQKPI